MRERERVRLNGIKRLKNLKKFIKRIKERKIRNKKSENRLFSLFVLNKNEEKLSINAAKRKNQNSDKQI